MHIKSFHILRQICGTKSPLGRNEKAKDGILFTLLSGMTFMLGCCPILSLLVARRPEHPHCKCILGNDGSNKLILCNLLSAFNTVILWFNKMEEYHANGPSQW